MYVLVTYNQPFFRSTAIFVLFANKKITKYIIVL